MRPTLRARSAKATKSSDPQANDLQAGGEGDAAPMDCRVGAHALSAPEALSRMGSSLYGLDASQAACRLKRLGPNTLPRYRGPDLASVVWHQFKSPMIVVLVVAAGISALLQAWSDAGFILAVLALNATIGSVQEWRAERSALALQGLIALKARVLRGGELSEIDAQGLVPGDVVLLEPGIKVPADLRLLDSQALTIDESLLTGESMPVLKHATACLPLDTTLSERVNLAFAASLVSSGRARGLVIATGAHTELGRIATEALGRAPPKAPLIQRMERFTHRITIAISVATALFAGISVWRGAPWHDVLMQAVALAVSAIPEGLPVALTVALAVSMQRMAQRGVIVRRLVAVESLGSCTYIASDKTGTLTVNQLTVRLLQFPGEAPWPVTGEGLDPAGAVLPPTGQDSAAADDRIRAVARTAVMCNEATLARNEGQWQGSGDSVDLALLVFGHKAGFTQAQCGALSPQVANIAYEPEQRYAASLHHDAEQDHVQVKGAVETLLPMCSHMHAARGTMPINTEAILEQARALSAQGYRVLAFAEGRVALAAGERFSSRHLSGLRFNGLAAMTDPPRPGAKAALEDCRRAGIRVGMVTGDHPLTALAVAQDLGLASGPGDVCTGAELAQAAKGAVEPRGAGSQEHPAQSEADAQQRFDALCSGRRVFARVEPQQKLQIVRSLQRQGHFVAVTGDGVNDAPALRTAHVGVAMGQRGTDLARETSDIVLTDDNFDSIVAGVEEGRIAYGNVRKVIFLLISTGAAEIVLFAFALLAGLPLPLIAVQLLWLNLVTNGIQDVALAFEPAEGNELKQPPRPTTQGILIG